MKQQKLRESEITAAASINPLNCLFLKSTILSHTTNFENTVQFVGEELHRHVLSQYLKLTEPHKNATYLSENSAFHHRN